LLSITGHIFPLIKMKIRKTEKSCED
jgi:hypothetical protein